MKFIITWDNRPKFCFLVRTASGNAVAYFCNRKDAENFCKVAALAPLNAATAEPKIARAAIP